MYELFIVKKESNPKYFEKKVISIESYINGESSYDHKDLDRVEEIIEFTVNFDDLGIWNVKKNVHNKSVPEIINNIQYVLVDLISKGYKIGEPDPDNYSWQWGHKKTNSILSANLDDRTRVGILMYHLANMKQGLEEHYNSDDYKILVNQCLQI